MFKCGHLRFALKTGKPLGIMRERFGQDLDGHVASEFGVVRLIHFSHFPGTDLRDDFVRAEMGASRERHYLFPDGTRRFQLFKPVQHDIDLRSPALARWA